ncbi:hypothetical protein [Sulfurimonas sp.]|uniref:COG3014 family protein n=1 Tax=Sulfurimonas sp. TaxID=2022749 RepID=UPI00260D2468|nr:hypothetical protein [Sulfurimonas sp.]MCW8895240.1 hypothetical protein [Sulfurimonas sp.]MCW9067591.1 hypothetical protein [Sulfurimonas sp.]
MRFTIFASLVSLLFSGCMANLANSIGVDLSNTLEQEKRFIAGDYAEAAALAVENKDKNSELDVSNLLSMLNAGNNYLYAKDYENSIKMLDESEAIIKFQHERILALNAGDYAAQLLLNDAAVDYKASITEAVMVNTYKSLDYMALKKLDKARVELNRAVDRQRRAKETYAKLIGKQKEAIAQKRREKNPTVFDKTLNNPQVKSIAQRNYSSLRQFEAYPDFINPFTTYLAGLFFAIDGDYSKSSSLLKEAHGMMPENKTLESDFEMVEKALLGRGIQEKYVWVIYENGLSPVKHEYKIDIPMYLVSQKINYIGIALPKMYTRSRATYDMSILSHGKLLDKTSTVADMDRVILTEFKYSYDDILTRAIFSAMLKTYTQYEAKKENGYLGLATTVFHLLTTRADVRLWKSLPKDFQVARVLMPSDAKLLLKAGEHNIDIELDKNAKHSIVYVRIPTAISKPSFSIINF